MHKLWKFVINLISHYFQLQLICLLSIQPDNYLKRKKYVFEINITTSLPSSYFSPKSFHLPLFLPLKNYHFHFHNCCQDLISVLSIPRTLSCFLNVYVLLSLNFTILSWNINFNHNKWLLVFYFTKFTFISKVFYSVNWVYLKITWVKVIEKNIIYVEMILDIF